jgi:hypothetical protein
VRFGRLTSHMFKRLKAVGFLGLRAGGPISDFTHPNTMQRLAALGGVVRAGHIQNYTNAPVVCGCIGFWFNSPKTVGNILYPLTQCARDQTCIRPNGANGFHLNGVPTQSKCNRGHEGHCHRGDQSALSIILYEAFEGRDQQSSHENQFPYIASVNELRVTMERNLGHKQALPNRCAHEFNRPSLAALNCDHA